MREELSLRPEGGVQSCSAESIARYMSIIHDAIKVFRLETVEESVGLLPTTHGKFTVLCYIYVNTTTRVLITETLMRGGERGERLSVCISG